MNIGNMIMELVIISDKSIREVLNDIEKLNKAGYDDEEALYIELRNYYLNGRREEDK